MFNFVKGAFLSLFHVEESASRAAFTEKNKKRAS